MRVKAINQHKGDDKEELFSAGTVIGKVKAKALGRRPV
jgi:hypothetical protein